MCAPHVFGLFSTRTDSSPLLEVTLPIVEGLFSIYKNPFSTVFDKLNRAFEHTHLQIKIRSKNDFSEFHRIIRS